MENLYLENDHLNSVLEEYLEDPQAINEFFSNSKQIYKMCKKMKSIIDDKLYKFYYITIVDKRTKQEYGSSGSGGYYGTSQLVETSTLRLYGSNIKLTKNDFVDTGSVNYRYKKSKDVKRLFKKSTYSAFIKYTDLDASLKKLIVMHKKAK